MARPQATALAVLAAAVTSVPQDELQLQVEAPASVSAGASMPLTLGIRNTGAQPLTLYLRGRTIAFDFLVLDRSGNVVWQRLHDQVVPAVVQIVTLGPGERREFRDTFRLKTNDGRPVSPGIYWIIGLLLRDDPEPYRAPPVPVRVLL
jgi:hypothetical protein